MLKKIRKPLVYLVSLMLALPTWLSASMIAPSMAMADIDTVSPTLNSVGFTVKKDSDPAVTINRIGSGVYALGINGSVSSSYKINFSSATTASEVLKDQYFALYLNPTLANVAALEAYYNTHSSGSWKTYLKAAANGVNPYAYIKQDGDQIELVDAAKHDILKKDSPMEIPGDYVAGNYTVNGTISDLANNLATISYTILIDNTAPVISIIQPVSDEEVSGGESYQIKWSASDLESGIRGDVVDIEYSLDNGANWILIQNSVANTGSYTWNVPAIHNDPVDIRISATNNAELISSKESSDFQIDDYTSPVITLIGENPMKLVRGATFTDPGANVKDNYDVAKTILSADAVDTNVIGSYSLKYVASDTAGNVALEVVRTVKVVAPSLVSPDITVSGSEKTINVSWNAVSGATGYYVYIGTTSDSNYVYKSPELSAATTSYSQTEGDYGTYYVRVTVVDANGDESTDSVLRQKSVVLAVASVSTTTSTSAAASSTIVASAEAKVSQPVEAASGSNSSVSSSPSSSTPTADDSQGKIKGEEENSSTSEEEEKVNWTPWIILFILIILAGAATGGYFYWFAGEEEIKESQPKEEVKPAVKSNDKPKPTTSGSSKNSKKSKRW